MLMFQDYKEAFDYIKTLSPAERSTYQTWIVVDLVKTISGLIILGLVVWALGRRLIHAIMSAIRESKHGRA